MWWGLFFSKAGVLGKCLGVCMNLSCVPLEFVCVRGGEEGRVYGKR